MTFILKTPTEIMSDLAFRIKSKRLELNLTQEGISSRAGVSLGSLKRFESTGQISLESLLKLAHAVGALADFDALFSTQKNRSKFEQDHYIYKFRLNGKNIPVVNSWHPANQFPDIMNYYCLMNIIKSIM